MKVLATICYSSIGISGILYTAILIDSVERDESYVY